ncbi:MAG TPA: flagellin, partial [Limnochordia bacterium]|nr:flagellin [Limnochordia bacterium]
MIKKASLSMRVFLHSQGHVTGHRPLSHPWDSKRQLAINQTNSSKSMERLSSGMRINRAGDDAAGLAISEKMRGQIRGLKQAQRNAQDGISLIQTAEGALNETHAILQRMRELAVQASTDTNTPADRAEIQKEIDQLSQELSRIGDDTEFNTQKLLNGTFSGTFHIGANESQNLKISVEDMRGFELGVAGKASVEVTADVEKDGDVALIADGTYTITGNSEDGFELINSDGIQVGQSEDGLTWKDMADKDIFKFTEVVDQGTVRITDGEAAAKAYVDNDGLQAGTYTISGTDVLDGSGNKIGTWNGTEKTVSDLSGTVLATFKGDVTEFKVGGVDVSTQGTANSAITTINNALETVSAERSKLGAYQNRLEHTIANLGTSAENLQAAESRIRDLDMAEEIM